MQHRILEKVYRNEYGKETNRYYYIQHKTRFMGIEYWKTIKHEVCYSSGCYNQTTEFNTYDEAKEFVDNVLCKDIPFGKWSEKIISYNEC